MPASYSPGPPPPPSWLGWAQVSLSTMLLVLFLVVLGRSHGQVQQLRQLQSRITALESQRNAERAATQDTQLHSFARRLEALEQRQEQHVRALEADRRTIEQALSSLRTLPRSSLPELEPLPEEPPPRRSGGGGLPVEPLRPPGLMEGGASQR